MNSENIKYNTRIHLLSGRTIDVVDIGVNIIADEDVSNSYFVVLNLDNYKHEVNTRKVKIALSQIEYIEDLT